MKSSVLHRIILNHLLFFPLNINNQEIISLLKQGNENTYQTILNRILDLNITNMNWLMIIYLLGLCNSIILL